LPLIKEQKRIVAKVDQLMAFCDELESKLRRAEADGEKLIESRRA
jgi:type I restriction enzyme S subunit